MPLKMTRAMREYKCRSCKRVIRKGEQYRKATISIGSPNKPDVFDGVGYMAHGIRSSCCYCAECATNPVPCVGSVGVYVDAAMSTPA